MSGQAHLAVESLSVHRTDGDFYYMDFGPILKGRTISSITSVVVDSQTAGSSDGTVSSSSVLSTNTTVYITEGNTRLIEANTGIKFKITGLTAASEYIVTAAVVLSDGNTIALDGILTTG